VWFEEARAQLAKAEDGARLRKPLQLDQHRMKECTCLRSEDSSSNYLMR
jgi:hypothetical protein